MVLVNSRGLALAGLLAQSQILPHKLQCDAFAFAPTTTKKNNLLASSSRLNMVGKDTEQELRKEIAKRNAIIEEEEKYSLADGDKMDLSEENDAEEDARISESTPLAAKIGRLTKTRAYPLFLLEKGAQLLEGIAPSFGSEESNDGYANGDSNRKERIVVLGTGWGSAAFLKDIDLDRYDVTIISPRNFFLFTPMLAGAAVGTVEYRSITEPVREISKNKAAYLEATATNIDPKTNTVVCESVFCEGTSCSINDFSVEYDYLVVSVGAQTNTFGIPGVREHCAFLKQVDDARRIRTSIVNCFERANAPNLSDEERKAILTFAVIGAGPTGIEFASELRDFVEQDGPKYYPNLLKNVRIKIIEASSTVLAPFDKSLQEEAIRQLARVPFIKDESVASILPGDYKLTELLLDSGVKEVTGEKIILSDESEIEYGLAVWAAGNGPLPLTLQLIDALGANGSEQAEAQDVARGRIATDAWMRAIGGDGKIIAFGDCSCVMSGQLPATAQVASQQGEYLANLFSKGYDFAPGTDSTEGILIPPKPDPAKEKSISELISAFATSDSEYAAPFQFLNLGILAYTGGGSALAQLQVSPTEAGRVKGTGKIGFGLWRSVYLSKQVSLRNRVLVIVDWIKTQAFGRDITRV